MFNRGALVAPAVAIPEAAPAGRPAFAVDDGSQLAEVDARLSLGAVEALLASANLTLGLVGGVDWSASVADWIALGFPGSQDPWDDPVASRVAGFEATVGDVQARVRATPRRATGPDLLSLFAGARGRVGVVDRVALVVTKRGTSAPRVQPFRWDRDPPLSAAERSAFELAATALRRSGPGSAGSG
jgi:FAD/FMN-containing dehydrogenase